MADDEISVFASYSHDSPEHKARVLALSNRLRAEGVTCEIDQYQASPPEGWPTWMVRQISRAQYVVVICTEKYFKRVTGEDPTGQGSKWEGALITQELYDSTGGNTKFIPVLMSPENEQFRPVFLRGATYYDVSTEDGYERLYRRLTNQPAVVKPPVGKLRTLAEPLPSTANPEIEQKSAPASPRSTTTRDLSAIVLVYPLEGDIGPLTMPSSRIEVRPGEFKIELAADDQKTASQLLSFQSRTNTLIAVAYGNQTVVGRLEELAQIVEDGAARSIMRLKPTHEHLENTLFEMSFQGLSADAIGELRARRLLLGERLSSTNATTVDQLNSGMLEVFVRGFNTPVEVKGSPFPGVFAAVGGDPEYFLAIARLFAVVFLHLSNTIEKIFTLELRLQATNLHVKFEGQRARKYQNVEAHVIHVEGTCDLMQSSEASSA